MIWHRCKWKAIAANPYTATEVGLQSPYRLFTRVLYSCECGERKVKEFEGHWELKDFQDGKESRNDRDVN